MNRTIGTSVISLITLLGVGCASTSQPPAQADSARDLAEMKERILELQEQAAITDVEIARLREQIEDLRPQLAGGASTAQAGPRTTEPEGSAPETPATPVGGMTPAIVESSDLETETIDETPPMAAPIQQEPAPVTAEATQLQPVEPAAQALYDRGYTLYHQGKYLDAEASFQRFLQAYPATELSDNAQFWIGESRYARGDVRGALGAFREVIQKYPEGNKVADALIKEGDCLEKLGDKNGARDRYSEVMRRFPDSGAAVMAEDRLAGLE